MTRTKTGALLCALGLMSAMVSATPQTKDAAAAAIKRKIVIDGKTVPANKVMVKDGVTYVEVDAVSDALGAKLESSEAATTVTLPQANCDATLPGSEGERFSQQFRSDVAGVADEIESLRAVMTKKENVELGPRFDAIDRKLTLATSHVQTDADMAVYYALSYASNSLAIAYYKQERGVPSDEAQKDQLDGMLCSMESKFALMKGALLPGGSCSVLKRRETQTPAKPAQP